MSDQHTIKSPTFSVFLALFTPIVLGLTVYFTLIRISTITSPDKSNASGVAAIERLNEARVSARPSVNPQ
ncbi:hypothetical protein [uncultured Cardiobacterium sp.]|uniref:hypothetical protein n=1 Tax=uncultured Cardiobacterium sp. TaxID=417619 RepID=UPI0026181F43|nr:hypothetical protein [uncultured Cardiobacterium sp.]